MKSSAILAALLSSAVLVFATGCAPEEFQEDELFSEADLPIMEAACTTVTPNATAVPPDVWKSSSDQFGHDACPAQYIVEVSSLSLLEDVTADWNRPLPKSAAECASSRLQYGWFAYKNGVWNTTVKGQRKYAGSWSSSTNECSWSMMSGYPTGDWSGASMRSNDKIRVVAHGWTWYNSGTTSDYKPLRISVLKIPD